MTIILTELTGSHDRANFDSGSAALDGWLQRTAMQHQQRGLSRTTVAVPADTAAVQDLQQRGFPGIGPDSILGFYCLSATQACSGELAVPAVKKLPNTIPLVRLGRLAVVKDMHGQGLGQLLLAHAYERGRQVALQVGMAGMVVDAKDARAAAFYQQFGFTPSPHNPLLLYRSLWQ